MVIIMPITERELRKAYQRPRHIPDLLTEQQISDYLLKLFNAGLDWPEARRIVPVGHNMLAFFYSEWQRWEAARRVRNTAVMCGNG
jgi:hypothetical protein